VCRFSIRLKNSHLKAWIVLRESFLDPISDAESISRNALVPAAVPWDFSAIAAHISTSEAMTNLNLELLESGDLAFDGLNVCHGTCFDIASLGS